MALGIEKTREKTLKKAPQSETSLHPSTAPQLQWLQDKFGEDWCPAQFRTEGAPTPTLVKALIDIARMCEEHQIPWEDLWTGNIAAARTGDGPCGVMLQAMAATDMPRWRISMPVCLRAKKLLRLRCHLHRGEGTASSRDEAATISSKENVVDSASDTTMTTETSTRVSGWTPVNGKKAPPCNMERLDEQKTAHGDGKESSDDIVSPRKRQRAPSPEAQLPQFKKRALITVREQINPHHRRHGSLPSTPACQGGEEPTEMATRKSLETEYHPPIKIIPRARTLAPFPSQSPSTLPIARVENSYTHPAVSQHHQNGGSIQLGVDSSLVNSAVNLLQGFSRLKTQRQQLSDKLHDLEREIQGGNQLLAAKASALANEEHQTVCVLKRQQAAEMQRQFHKELRQKLSTPKTPEETAQRTANANQMVTDRRAIWHCRKRLQIIMKKKEALISEMQEIEVAVKKFTALRDEIRDRELGMAGQVNGFCKVWHDEGVRCGVTGADIDWMAWDVMKDV